MSLTPDIERVQEAFADQARSRVTLALIGWYTRSWATPPDPGQLLATDPGSYVCVNAVDEAEVVVQALAEQIAALVEQREETAKREAPRPALSGDHIQRRLIEAQQRDIANRTETPAGGHSDSVPPDATTSEASTRPARRSTGVTPPWLPGQTHRYLGCPLHAGALARMDFWAAYDRAEDCPDCVTETRP